MRIAQCLADTGWGSVGPHLLHDGCGGRELCVLALSEAWADQGHDVTNMVPRDDVEVLRHDSGGSQTFCPVDGAVHALRASRFDAIVSVELPEVLLDVGVRVTQEHVPQLVHFQVAHARGDAAIVCQRYIEMHGSLPFRWSSLSDWHTDFLSHQLLGLPALVHPNGCFSDDLHPQMNRSRGPVFHWGSSPDRGLRHLRYAWPKIRRKMRNARLHVLYGVERFLEHSKWSHNEDAEAALDVEELLGMEGVVYNGLTTRPSLSKILRESSALLYPCDPMSPTETGCITAIEAAAAGCVPVLSDADCLKPEFRNVADILMLPIQTDEIVDAAERAVDERTGREQKLLKFGRTRDWEVISRRWLETFETLAA